mmetsp:Transcript_24277/g.43034  ORF Transcript_24277/g.43034 Transcript_24277/m.43034 type:complete len:252 (+) Transcript_24277:164-919(+)|eukprot:CAMPEP_0197534298 /NCGR_PEP_ID=MMETSP1318-20131121/46607_1 /TAXON_ID=552666 /ORGANISM="Partenskyella glossopodia, Strain RCC365" /LENGTH=251 /DNA_ID=CAMNT_0043091505 /DNA_START=152 /DNA_END=907 /DNA_ORIENTATION=-
MDPLHADEHGSGSSFGTGGFGGFGGADDDLEANVDPVDELISTFQSVVVQAKRKMNIIPHVATGELKQNVEQLTDLYYTARDTLDKVEDEVQSTANGARYERTLRLLNKDCQRLEERYNRVMNREDVKRIRHQNSGQRTSALIEDQLTRENTESIEHVTRQLNETTEQGGMIMNDLKSQTDTLKRSVHKVLETGEVLKESKRILDGMARSAATNKLTTALIILLEVFIICVIIYYKYVMNYTNHSNRPNKG